MPTEEDIYFIIGISRRGVEFPSFIKVPTGYVARSQLVYSQRYIGVDILSLSYFHVFGGRLRISAFGSQEVRFLSLLISTISHNTSDGQCISCSLLYYVDSLVQEPWLARWFSIFLQQFCKTSDRFLPHEQGRVKFPFASEFFCLFFERFPETRPTFFLAAS